MNEFIRHQSKSYPLFGDYVIYIHDHEQLVRGSAKWGLVIDIFSSFVSVTTKSLEEDALISVCLRMWEWNNITGCVCECDRGLEREKFIVYIFSVWNNTESHDSSLLHRPNHRKYPWNTHVYMHTQHTKPSTGTHNKSVLAHKLTHKHQP